MHKCYVLRLGLDIFYIDEIEYTDHEDRYQKTKDVPAKYIYENIDDAIDRLIELNGI